MRACKEAKFPICLDRSMLRMFGPKGKKSIESIVMNEELENMAISTPKDVWHLYDKFIEEVGELYGDDISGLVEYGCMREMESMFCMKCPLYESVAKKCN